MTRSPKALRDWSAPAVASCAVHATIALAAAWSARHRPPQEAPRRPSLDAAEVSFEALPQPTERASSAAPAARVTAAPPPPRAHRRAVAPVAPTGATRETTARETVEVTPEATPEVTPARPTLRASALIEAGRAMASTMAGEAIERANSPEGVDQRLRGIAMAPTTAALAERHHALPTGTVGHDREVARRAQEFLDPYAALPDVSRRLTGAPTVSMGFIQRTATAGEVTAGEAADEAHAQSYRTVQMPPGYAPCQDYRALRLEAVLRYDATGAVTDARVASSTGVRRLDEAALAALRAAHGEVSPARGGTPSTMRWMVEVGEDRDAHAPIACGALGGWTVWAARGASFGVRVRARRMREL